ncbi:hypothetical protein SONE68_2440 [Lacticaseibacillus paracasei]|nr:hypothetical protein SONE68_2440 [Lacticaseibacillus paracasei]
MKKLNQMRMANDQQLKQIHGTDYAYTETVVIYLRGALRKNPYAVEHAISDLLTTLIDAQTAGRKVSTFFGDDPETAADNIWQITSLIRTSPESFNGSLLMMYF